MSKQCKAMILARNKIEMRNIFISMLHAFLDDEVSFNFAMEAYLFNERR